MAAEEGGADASDDLEEAQEDDERLQQARLEQLLQGNEHLELENKLLRSYLDRVSPHYDGLDEAEDAKKKRTMRRGKPDAKQVRQLTAEEKNDIVTNEMEVLQAETKAVQLTGEKEIDDVKTMIEERDMQIAEIKKETYEFKRDIIMGAENTRTGKIVAEKLLRFLNDRIKAKEATVEKLTLKNASLRQQIAKMNQQLSQKEEMGEVLHVVDFDQLKIENQQYMAKIEEKNKALLRLKLTTSRTVQALNQLKHQLSSVVQRSTVQQREIAEKEKQLSKFDENFCRANHERRQAEDVYKRLKFQQGDVEQPQIMDYLKVKVEVQELEHKVVDWKRKIEISEMENCRMSRVLRTVSAASLQLSP